MRALIVLVLLGLAAGAAPRSQADAPREGPSAEARERIEAIDREAADARQAREEENARRRAEHAAAKEQAAAAGAPPPPPPPLLALPDYAPQLARLAEWADRSAGEDQALYLARAATLGGLAPKSPGRAAFERLLAQHPTSASWTRVGPLLTGLERAFDAETRQRTLDVLAQHPDADVRGWVAVAAHARTLEQARADSEEYRAARAALVAALEEARDERVRDELQAPIDLRERLAVGATAPDIAGVDLDGVEFKLSDHQGKVILLSFWGDW